MSTTVRNIFIAVVLIVVLVAGALYYLASNLNGIVAGLIEEQGSVATQTAVRVTGVDIQLREAAAGVSGLSVANPEGFTGNAIELGQFQVELDPASLTQDTIVVNNVLVDGARINLIQQGVENNLQKLLANLPASAEAETTTDAGSGKKVIIEKFTLSGASASVTAPGLDEAREVALPDIVVNGIGRASGGATGAQVARQILKPIVEKALTSTAAEELKGRAMDKIDDVLGGALKKIGRE